MAKKSATPWRNRIVETGTLAPAEIIPNPENWREHPEKQQKAMTGALAELGWVQPVVINRTTGRLIDGHMRVALALRQGEAAVPVSWVELSEQEEKLALATIDPLGDLAKTSDDDLRQLLEQLTVSEKDLGEFLFSLDDLADSTGSEQEDVEEKLTRADELQEKWAVRPGDLWQAGNHRVACGSSTDAEVVRRVLGGAKPGLMVTDPPYGVNYDAEWREEAGLAKRGTVAKGKVTNDHEDDWSDAYRLFPGDVAYVWHAAEHGVVVAQGLTANQLELRAQVIWAKSQLVISRRHYHPQHEACWYAVRKGSSAKWNGDRKQSTLWEIEHRKNDTGHSTQKPLLAMLRPIHNHDFPEVYDPFVGSGTTLVAAEKLGRSGFGVEIEPKYVAIVLDRLADLGLEPKLIERDGKPV
jgi:DNA modification methylase